MEDNLIIALAIFATALPLWMGQRYGVVRLVSPMHILGYFCAAGFLVKAIVYPVAPEWAFYARFIDTPGAAVIGAMYLTAFIMLMCLEYRVAVHPLDGPCATNAVRWTAGRLVRRNWLFAAAFGMAGLTLALLLQARGISALQPDLLQTLNTDKQIHVDANGVGSTLAGIKTFFVVPKCAFVLLLAYGLAQGDRGATWQAIILAGLLVFTAMISGDRFELVELLAYAAATFLIMGGRVRLRSVILAATGAATVLLLSAYMTALRGSEAGLLHQVVASTYFLDFNAAIMVTDRVAPAMYLWGDSYTWWSFGWFPRVFWEGKPAIDLGVFFKRDVMDIATGGAFNVTGPGEAFINFGWAGALIGFVLGWCYRKIEVTLLGARGALRHASFVYYPLLFYPFVQATLQSSFSAFIVGAAAQFILIAAVVVLCVPRARLPMRRPLITTGYA